MVAFTSVAPHEFIPYLGYNGLSFTKELVVFNMCSYDIHFQKVNNLMPSVPGISETAYVNDESMLFEREYFEYLQRDESAFLDLMRILTKEFYDGQTCLILVEIVPYNTVGRNFCDSVVESLIKYMYMYYGIQAQVIQSAEDIFNLKDSYSVFSPEGLMRMDQHMAALAAICPELLQ